jgi:hypothetical protein
MDREKLVWNKRKKKLEKEDNNIEKQGEMKGEEGKEKRKMKWSSNKQNFTREGLPGPVPGHVGGEAEVCDLDRGVLAQQDVVRLDVWKHTASRQVRNMVFSILFFSSADGASLLSPLYMGKYNISVCVHRQTDKYQTYGSIQTYKENCARKIAAVAVSLTFFTLVKTPPFVLLQLAKLGQSAQHLVGREATVAGAMGSSLSQSQSILYCHPPSLKLSFKATLPVSNHPSLPHSQSQTILLCRPPSSNHPSFPPSQSQTIPLCHPPSLKPSLFVTLPVSNHSSLSPSQSQTILYCTPLAL